MTTTPTVAPSVEAFLAQQHDPEDEDLDQPSPDAPTDPLESIADSLRRIVGGLEQLLGDDQAPDQCEHADDYAEVEEEYRRVVAQHDAKQTLIEDVLKICAKSTSKLADSIRALLEAPVAVPEPDTSARAALDEDEVQSS